MERVRAPAPRPWLNDAARAVVRAVACCCPTAREPLKEDEVEASFKCGRAHAGGHAGFSPPTDASAVPPTGGDLVGQVVGRRCGPANITRCVPTKVTPCSNGKTLPTIESSTGNIVMKRSGRV